MSTASEQVHSNRVVFRKLAVVAVIMFGFGYAMVPFYKKICEVSGLSELAQADEVTNSQVDTSRWLVVQFDANTRDLPWVFEPLERQAKVHPGQLIQITYRVKNNSDSVIVGQAIPSYGPSFVAGHVKKLECFCFTRQELKPGEVRDMPVQLVIDNKLPSTVDTVTLSYTFFEVPGNPRLQKAVKG